MNKVPVSPRLAVFLIVLLDIMGVGLIIPVQPFLAQHFGATTTVVTLLGTTYSLMQFAWAPLWGGLSDRLGRKPVLLLTIVTTLAGHLAFAASNSLLALFAARALAGIGAANIATAQAVLSDTHAPSERSRAMALIGVAFGVGFILGPLLGGLLSQLDYRAPAIFAALLALLNTLFVAFRLQETRVATHHDAAPRLRLRTMFSASGELQQLILTTLFTMTAFSIMEQSISLYIGMHWVPEESTQRIKLASRFTSIYLVTVGITAIFVQGFLVRRWLKSTAELPIVRVGLATLVLSLLLVPFLGSIGSFNLFLVSGAALALGSGLFNPSMAGLVSKSCSEENQGLGLAMNQSAVALGRIIGPTVAGALLTTSSAAPFVTGALLTSCALLVSLKLSVNR
jgi:DHA1 family tetracycline resistance protein-like MFS transporter